MTDNFKSLSIKVANDFLQSVVFIDDQADGAASESDDRHGFDVQEVTRSFAQDKKICSVLQPLAESDIKLFSAIAQKADVTVLDWKIIIPKEEKAIALDDSDDGDDDIRGKYTKEIIGGLLGSPSSLNSLKLIIVYTGETDLSGICSEIEGYLFEKNIGSFSISDDDKCCVSSKSCNILVRAKSNGGEGRGKYDPNLLDKEVSFDGLPEFINTEFSKMTSGLISNFALKSLTAIRENSHQILNIFSKQLDRAYLTNQSLLVNTEEANELLVELLGDTFTSILRANNLNKFIDDDFVSFWLEMNVEDTNKPAYNKKGDGITGEYALSKDAIKDLLKPHPDVFEKFQEVLSQTTLSKSQITKKSYKKYAFDLLHNESEKESRNIDFANLCQHKNLVHNEHYIPTLSLGTVVKSSLGTNNYLVCIQQRCDSVRIKKTDERRFLFLTLSAPNQNGDFDFVSPDGKKLRLGKKTFNLRTVKFYGSEDGVVKPNSEDGHFFFEPLHAAVEPSVEPPDASSEKFEFVFELKDLYAQRIVTDYSASLSRVGLDEPEWVRLSRN